MALRVTFPAQLILTIVKEIIMPLSDMGQKNDRWGVCGFTSSLYALYNNSPGLAHGDLSNVATSDIRFLNMIADYLDELQATGAAQLRQSIEAFTGSFPGYSGFSIDEYVRRIRFIGTINATKAVGDFSLAMPPPTVVDFLKRRCGFGNAQVLGLADPARTEEVLGLSDPTGGLQQYGGLCHYVYKNAAGIHSWGDRFDDVAAAGAGNPDTVGWTVCVRIALR